MRSRCRLIMTFDNSFSVICDEARRLGFTASFARCRIDFYYNYTCKPWLFHSYSTCAHLYMYLCMYVFKYIFISVDSCKNQHQKEQKRKQTEAKPPSIQEHPWRNECGCSSDRLFHMVKLHRLIFASGCTCHWETTEL